jgi:replication factor C small subunit
MSSQLWIDKYRPTTLSDIIGHRKRIKELQAYVASPLTTPYLLIFEGPAGTGKTAAARALAHDMLGFGENFKVGWKELNASDARTLKDFRETVKIYIKNKPFLKIPFKFLLLDEGDELTPAVQNAMRSEIEKYSDRTKVIICCNRFSKISKEMQSRGKKMTFGPLSITAVKKMLGKILTAEHIAIEDEAYEALMSIYKGDMRKTINAAQGAVDNGIITKDAIIESAGYVDDATVKKLLEVILKGDFNGACSYVGSLLWSRRLEPQKISTRIGEYISKNQDIDILHRLKIARIVANTNSPIVFGADASTQLYGLIATIIEELFHSSPIPKPIIPIGPPAPTIKKDEIELEFET